MAMRLSQSVMVTSLILASSLIRAADADDIYAKFVTDGRVQNRLVIAATAVLNGRGIRLSVPNKDDTKPTYEPKPELLAIIDKLKAGDVFKATYDLKNNTALVSAITPYAMKPGEELPNGFVFNESYDKREGKLDYQMVDVKKFDQVITLVIPNRKDPTSGNMAPDPELLADAATFKPGDVVLIDATKSGTHPQIKSIELYTEPVAGTFIKSSTEKDNSGKEETTVEIEGADGKTITAVVPGRMDGKKWVPDLKVEGEVKRLHPNLDVMYRATEDNGKTVLRFIQKAAKQTKHTNAETQPAAEKPMKPDKKPVDAK